MSVYNFLAHFSFLVVDWNDNICLKLRFWRFVFLYLKSKVIVSVYADNFNSKLRKWKWNLVKVFWIGWKKYIYLLSIGSYLSIIYMTHWINWLAGYSSSMWGNDEGGMIRGWNGEGGMVRGVIEGWVGCILGNKRGYTFKYRYSLTSWISQGFWQISISSLL